MMDMFFAANGVKMLHSEFIAGVKIRDAALWTAR